MRAATRVGPGQVIRIPPILNADEEIAQLWQDRPGTVVRCRRSHDPEYGDLP